MNFLHDLNLFHADTLDFYIVQKDKDRYIYELGGDESFQAQIGYYTLHEQTDSRCKRLATTAIVSMEFAKGVVCVQSKLPNTRAWTFEEDTRTIRANHKPADNREDTFFVGNYLGRSIFR